MFVSSRLAPIARAAVSILTRRLYDPTQGPALQQRLHLNNVALLAGPSLPAPSCPVFWQHYIMTSGGTSRIT